jgi:large subunit ribosomal protein L1
MSFSAPQLVDNLRSLLQAIARVRPASAKGNFLRSLYVSTTMGPGLKIDLQSLDLA